LNRWGHAGLLHIDKKGNITFYDISKDDDDKSTKVRKYTQGEWNKKYGGREYEVVCVCVPDEAKTVGYCEDRVGDPWDYGLISRNCVCFAQSAIKAGGGEVVSDGSHGEYPEIYPRDARDGYRKAAKKRRKRRPTTATDPDGLRISPRIPMGGQRTPTGTMDSGL